MEKEKSRTVVRVVVGRVILKGFMGYSKDVAMTLPFILSETGTTGEF